MLGFDSYLKHEPVQVGEADLIVELEYLLDRPAEVSRQAHGERQTRIKTAGLDEVDRLARHPDVLAQSPLRQALRLAQQAQAVLHGRAGALLISRPHALPVPSPSSATNPTT